MSKRHRNVPHPGYFKVQGGAVEEPDIAREAKQAVAREQSRLHQRAGLKTRKGEAPPEQHVKEQPLAEPLVASMKEELEAKGTAPETVGAAVMREEPPAEEHRGLVRSVAGRAFGAVKFMFGFAGRMVQLPFLIIDRLRHHDEMHTA